MTVSDEDRRDLFVAFEGLLGGKQAKTMMELLPPVGWGDVARQSDLTALRGEMAELRAELKGEMAEFRAELKGEMAEFRAELKGDIAGLLPRLIAANVASMIGVAGLVLAAVAIG